MAHTRIAIIGGFLLLLPWQHAANGADLEDRVRQWLLAARAEAAQSALPSNIRVVYEGVVPNQVTDEELADWRSQVRGIPQHPLRSEIAIAERRIAKGGCRPAYAVAP